jgi:hypothetical protein
VALAPPVTALLRLAGLPQDSWRVLGGVETVKGARLENEYAPELPSNVAVWGVADHAATSAGKTPETVFGAAPARTDSFDERKLHDEIRDAVRCHFADGQAPKWCRSTEGGQHHVTVPKHDSLRLGTLSAVLTDVADTLGGAGPS